jgi:predicted DNA-binding protein YlxM (UPF0122 family)
MEIKREHKLYDFYAPLLTNRQREIYEATEFEDLSLAEAADEFGVSRNAIFETIKKVNKNLEDYEAKLRLFSKSEKRAEIYYSIEDKEIVKRLESIDTE